MKPTLLAILALCLALGACKSKSVQPAEPPVRPAPAAKPAAKPVEPPIQAKPAEPPPAVPAKAEARLAAGVKAYEDGDYKTAQQELQGALDQGLANRVARVRANKYLAFVACATGDRDECKAHFRTALAIDPKFQLSKAEAGHPLWGPVFKQVKAEAAARKAPAKSK